MMVLEIIGDEFHDHIVTIFEAKTRHFRKFLITLVF